MEPSITSSALPSTNPPSIESAYRRKCIALKKRLNEVEAENELMRLRNRRGWQYIQKMRLESCILLERLSKVTGMAEEAQVGLSPELRARAAALMSSSAALNNIAAGGDSAAGHAASYLDDETEGSSDDQPPTPQERPLRIKRSRKSNMNMDGLDDEVANNESTPAASGNGTSLPRLAPAPTQEELTSTFRVQSGSNGSATPVAPEMESASHEANDRDHGDDDAQENNGEEPGEQLPSSMPMDMDIDTKVPKEES
ncbi:hypothetical protein ASPZODRAFT_132051 [Penicilliopsis zonata CBS 506.65]|uniref:INO80 complex subunit F domain-containing protein n=1 Tax=Penicilliopsis zonata CBS 506.65 TaxID=1073090 RepID=A0A1L9SIR0_9EURO|nr:hypothetical protein ASPZODRAFT_132051 [Penicilliopsis zonata CBS 506.65]OJJ47109.1 hypothetical protein ASPZODRAFT_132051 [Penicilliopsis zonata CBS 506.65]